MKAATASGCSSGMKWPASGTTMPVVGQAGAKPVVRGVRLDLDVALSGAADQPVAAVRAFFEVALSRIAVPDVPDGCLVVQSVLATPALSPRAAQYAQEAVGFQRTRLRIALKAGGVPDETTFAVHIAAVNQSLAVMSRAGVGAKQLRAIVEVSLDALARAGDAPARRRASAHTG